MATTIPTEILPALPIRKHLINNNMLKHTLKPITLLLKKKKQPIKPRVYSNHCVSHPATSSMTKILKQMPF